MNIVYLQTVATPGTSGQASRGSGQPISTLIVGDSQTREFPALETETVVCWPGATFEDVPRRLRRVEGSFDNIVLFLGTCEVERRRPATMTLSKAFAQIREVILSKWPGAVVMTTNAPPRGAQNLRAQTQAVNSHIKKCAIRHHLQVINVHKALCKRQKHMPMLKRDGVHLTPAALGACAHLVRTAVGRSKKN